MGGKNFYEMTDEEIEKSVNTVRSSDFSFSEDGEEENTEENTEESTQEDSETTEANAEGENETESEEQEDEGESSTDDSEGESDSDEEEEKSNAKSVDASKSRTTEDDSTKKTDTKSKSTNEAKTQSVNYQAEYEKLLKPFVANGKEISVNNVDEAVRMMQQGANYTRKMQALAPKLKILRMLENNKLLDEDVLSGLIDVYSGDKAAIGHFLKSKGIDPMDISDDSDTEYKPRNHKVSDDQHKFQSIVEDVHDNDHGKQLIDEIQSTWDQSSKNEVFADPAILQVLTTQRASGIYQKIAAQIEKLKLMGDQQILKMPFLHAYQAVGSDMDRRGLLAPTVAPSGSQGQGTGATKEAPTAIARQTAPRKAVSNGQQVKAASPTTVSAKKSSSSEFDPMSMSDEEILAYASKMKHRA